MSLREDLAVIATDAHELAEHLRGNDMVTTDVWKAADGIATALAELVSRLSE